MPFKVIWAERASQDLLDLRGYLAARDPLAAVRITRGVYRDAGRLAEFPNLGSALEEVDDPRWRRIVFRDWKIVYEILPTESVVRVLRIWHAARGPVQLD